MITLIIAIAHLPSVGHHVERHHSHQLKLAAGVAPQTGLVLVCPSEAAVYVCWLPVLQLEILEAHKRKQAEEADFKAALAAALAERDAEGRSLIAAYNKVHKHVMRSGTDDPAVTEEQVRLGCLLCRMCVLKCAPCLIWLAGALARTHRVKQGP